MKKLKKAFHGTVFSFKLMLKYKEGFKYGGYKIFLAVLDSVVPFITTVFPGLIINELIGDRRIEYIAGYIAALAIVPFIKDIIYTLSGKRLTALYDALTLRLHKEFFLFHLRMDYETLEDPALQDEMNLARSTFNDSPAIVDQVIAFLTAVINVIIYLFVIVRFDFYIILIVTAFAVINLFTRQSVSEKLFDYSKKFQRFDRILGSYHWMFDNQSYGKEFRVFDLSEYLVGRFEKVQKEYNALDVESTQKGSVISIVASILSCVQLICIYAIFTVSIIRKSIPVGDLTIGLSAASQLTGKLQWAFNTYVDLYNRSMYVEDMERFFNRPNRTRGTGTLQPVFEGNSCIEFKNVSFKYPGSDTYALKNVNLKIKANERLCIVGQNGSGKSTLVKLLTRLYMPCEGEITLNGINIVDYDYDSYLKLFAPVFQDFVEYEFTAKDNIILNNPEDKDRLDDVIKKTGLDTLFAKLPRGYNTMIGKSIDPEGFDPSGGESQRMAIARAMYRGGKVFVLDEPTAALDPIQEYEIYVQFNNMIEDSCAVIITHRLSAVQLADKVAVFESGHVAEYGTHAELYAKGGIYTEMFDKQAHFYREADGE